MSDETIDPAKNKTLVGLRADMKFGKELVPIQGFVGEEFHLKLQKPAPIGSAMSVAYWLKDAFKVDSPGMKVVTLEGVDTGKDFAEIPKADLKTKIEKNLATQGVPPAAIEVLTSLLAARVEVNALSIDVIPEKKKEGDKPATPGKTTVVFGLAVNFEDANLKLFGDIELERISMLFVSAPEGDPLVTDAKEAFLAKDKAALAIEDDAAKAAEGTIIFKQITAQTKLKLGGKEWAFFKSNKPEGVTLASKLGADMNATVSELAKQLTACEDKDIKKYRYEAKASSLRITCISPGKSGNGVAVAVQPEADRREDITLAGGQDAGKPD